MLAQSKNRMTAINLSAAFAIASFLLLYVFSVTATGQVPVKQVKASQAAAHKAANFPSWQGYKEIKIGTTADEVRAKLGKATAEDKDGFFYTFSDTESAQILLDGEQKVRVISVMYSKEHSTQPKFEDVFGKTEHAEPKPDGAIYKMVRYTEAGYWVAYNRLAGETALVTVTIQKL
jgi:outer membrane protein assembly factor BamE (lipoprotein component of BamABCDE complex)